MLFFTDKMIMYIESIDFFRFFSINPTDFLRVKRWETRCVKFFNVGFHMPDQDAYKRPSETRRMALVEDDLLYYYYSSVVLFLPV